MSEGRVTAGVPGAAIDIPGRVLDLAGTDKIQLVWRNELGGLTFRSRGQKGTRYIKWQSYAGVRPAVRGDVDLAVESEKLRWAGQFVRVPGVLDFGEDGDAAWLVTEAIDATPACDVRWRGDPEVAVRAIAMGLRRFHDTLPVDGCPYRGSWSSREPSAPASAGLVVCHGDPCVPNTLLDSAGEFAGHVDLSRLGVADRWADLAIATYSISWDANFGKSYDHLFFGAYGIEPDLERIRFYRELWDEE